MNDVRVIILCKAPVPGRVKTRLMPDYSPEEAARLHAAMARTVISRTSSLFTDVRVAADESGHPFFADLGLPVMAQGPGDLGERLISLGERAYAENGSPVLFLGTDCPHMPTERLMRAATLIQTHDVVLGPVEDGGYDLIGMTAPCDALFHDIPWSSSRVLVRSFPVA